MAGVKISALPVSPGLDGTEIVPVVDGGVTRRTTVAAIAALGGGAADLTDYVGNSISLEATAGDLVLLASGDEQSISLGADNGVFIVGSGSDTDSPIQLSVDADNKNISIISSGIGGDVLIGATGVGGQIVGNADFITLNANGVAFGPSVGLIASNPSGVVYLGAGDPDIGDINTSIGVFGSGLIDIIANEPGTGSVGISADSSITIDAQGQDGVVNIFASGIDALLNIRTVGTGGQIGVTANESVTLNVENNAIQVDTDVVNLIAGEIGGTILISANAGFTFAGTTQTGIAVNAAAIHAALVALGLITA